jgi:hypothetical protein
VKLRLKSLFFLSGCLGGFLSHATLVEPMDSGALVRRAPIVAYGQVAQIEVDASTGRRTAIFEAFDLAKAPQAYKHERDFYIPLMNRAIPQSDLVETVIGAPELKLGDVLVVFLAPLLESELGPNERRADGRPVYSLVGFHQGKFRVVKDRDGIRRALSWDEGQENSSRPKVADLRSAKTTKRVEARISEEIVNGSEKFQSLDSLLSKARAAPQPGVGQ